LLQSWIYAHGKKTLKTMYEENTPRTCKYIVSGQIWSDMHSCKCQVAVGLID